MVLEDQINQIKREVNITDLNLTNDDLEYLFIHLRRSGFTEQGVKQWFLDNKDKRNWSELIKWARDEPDEFFMYERCIADGHEKYIAPEQVVIDKEDEKRIKEYHIRDDLAWLSGTGRFSQS